MAETIERIYKLTVDGTAAARSLGEIEKATAQLDARFKASGAAIKAFAVGLAGAVSAGVVVNGIRDIIDSFDQLSKDAQKVGIAAEELQRLRYAADMSGVSAETLDKAIVRLSTGMSELATGTSDTAKALRSVGAQGGESTLQVLTRISDQFQNMPDGIEKTALAVELFGKAAGPDLVPLLNAGGDALKELTDEADRFGGVISGDVLKAAEAFNDDLSRLQRTMAGVGAQISSGMLPALQAITRTLTEATATGSGFVSVGESIGEMLIGVTEVAIKSTSVLAGVGKTLAFVAAAGTARPQEVGTIFRAWVDDINALDKTANEQLARVRRNFEDAKAAANASRNFVGPPAPAGGGGLDAERQRAEAAAAAELKRKKAAEEADKASRAAAKAASDHAKAENERWKALVQSAEAMELMNQTVIDAGPTLNATERNILREIEARRKIIESMDNEEERRRAEADELQALVDLMETGTEAQKQYAAAKLAATASSGKLVDETKKERDALDVLNDGFENFFDNLASGTADAEDLFKRMVQSIIAELLKLWAKKYIIDAVSGFFGGGTTKSAKGNVFESGRVLPFAKGGVVSRPFTFPMGLAGEAGPEGILPLKRTASGDLGVQSNMPQMSVTVNNTVSDVAAVSVEQRENDISITLSRVRAALTADIVRGGNEFATAAERAWSLNRGQSAGF